MRTDRLPLLPPQFRRRLFAGAAAVSAGLQRCRCCPRVIPAEVVAAEPAQRGGCKGRWLPTSRRT